MNLQQPTRFDATYYLRYVRRNRKKIDAVLQSVGVSKNLLDIGCNQGYVTRAFLERGFAEHGSAIELDAVVVDPWLIASERFSLFEGNVLDYKFSQVFDVIIFNSVFHHVFGTYGKEIAFDLWDRVIDHCDRVLIFETGVLTEFGRYYWKDEFLKYYISDDEVIQTLLARVGPRLKKVEIILSPIIHLTQRPIYKIELYPVGSEYDLKHKETEFYGDVYQPDSEWTSIYEYRRTRGSKNQRLLKVSEISAGENLMFEDTAFFRLQSEDGRIGFAKKILNDPYKRMREFSLLKNVDHPNIIKMLAVHPEYGFIFQNYDWQNLGDVTAAQIRNSPDFVSEISSFFDWASKQFVAHGRLDVTLMEKQPPRRLIDVVDFHPNNFLVKVENDAVVNWTLVDLESALHHSADRNYKYLYQLLMQAHPKSISCLFLYCWFYLRSYLFGRVKLHKILLRYFYDFLAKIFLPSRSYLF